MEQKKHVRPIPDLRSRVVVPAASACCRLTSALVPPMVRTVVVRLVPVACEFKTAHGRARVASTTLRLEQTYHLEPGLMSGQRRSGLMTDAASGLSHERSAQRTMFGLEYRVGTHHHGSAHFRRSAEGHADAPRMMSPVGRSVATRFSDFLI